MFIESIHQDAYCAHKNARNIDVIDDFIERHQLRVFNI